MLGHLASSHLEKQAMHTFIPVCAFVDLQSHFVCKQWCHWVRNIMQPHDRKQVWWGGLSVLFQGVVRRLLSPEAYFGPLSPFQWYVKLLWNFFISYLASWGMFWIFDGWRWPWRHWLPLNIEDFEESQTVSGFVFSSSIASAGVFTLLLNACLCYQGILDLVSLNLLREVFCWWLTTEG